MLKFIWKFIKTSLMAFACMLLVYFFLAWLLPKFKVNQNFTETPDGVKIYLCSNGVHTDLVLPVNTPYINWRKQFVPSTFKAVDNSFDFIEIGWGDKAFYLNTPTWADLKFSTAFNALFFLDSSAVHVTYVRDAPLVVPSVCKMMSISSKQYIALINYIQSSLVKADGKVVLIPGKGYDVYDNFYEAEGHYSFIKTCNVWTADALKSAGVKQGLWAPFEGGVMHGSDK